MCLRSQLSPRSVLVAKLGYSVGFLIVILGRQQLFTENTLTPILPTLFGNIASGIMLVAALNHAQVVAGSEGQDI